jgi:hypothetical protein
VKRSSDLVSAFFLIDCVQDLRYFAQVHIGPNGYPKLARFLDSDDNFMVYRRFGFLQTRLLLERQDALRVLEERLDKLDESEIEGGDNKDNLCSRDGDGGDQTERINLMAAIRTAFQEYGSLHQASPWGPIADNVSRAIAGCSDHGSSKQANYKRIHVSQNFYG